MGGEIKGQKRGMMGGETMAGDQFRIFEVDIISDVI